MELCFLAFVVATGLKGIVWSHPVSAEIRIKVGNFPTPIPPKTRMKQQKDQQSDIVWSSISFFGCRREGNPKSSNVSVYFIHVQDYHLG